MDVIGIDPGIGGALVRISDGVVTDVVDMPTGKVRVGRRTANRVDEYRLARIIENLTPFSLAVVEKVSAAPGQGVSSSFAFGVSFGLIRGAFAGLNYAPPLLIRPQDWKRLTGLSGSDKQASVRHALILYPELAEHLTLKKHDGRAEAALIATAGFLKLKGTTR